MATLFLPGEFAKGEFQYIQEESQVKHFCYFAPPVLAIDKKELRPFRQLPGPSREIIWLGKIKQLSSHGWERASAVSDGKSSNPLSLCGGEIAG